MEHFPLFFNLKDRDVYIFGGGAHALERVEKLLPFSPRLTVIARQISERIKKTPGVSWKERDFLPEDLEGTPAFVVIAEEEAVTQRIYSLCKARNIPVNAVDMPKYCDIIFPSVVATEHLCIGISSGGISPTATVEYKDRIRQLIPEGIDRILEWMPQAKAYIRENAPGQSYKALLRKAFQQALQIGEPLDCRALEQLIRESRQ